MNGINWQDEDAYMSEKSRMTDEDEARAQKLYFELSAATMREPYHDAVADIKLIADAFRAIRDEAMQEAEALYLKNARQIKVEVREEALDLIGKKKTVTASMLAGNQMKYMEGYYAALNDIERAIRTHGTPGEGGTE